MKILSPFGPKIAKLKFSNSIIKKINNEVDKIIAQEKLSKKYDYSKKLVGQVKQEIELPKIFIKKNLDKLITHSIRSFIKSTTGKNIKKIKIKNLFLYKFQNQILVKIKINFQKFRILQKSVYVE